MTNYTWFNYQYRVAKLVIKAGSMIKEIESGMIDNLFIEKNFDSEYLPVFLISIMMGTQEYNTIIANPDNATVTLQLQGFIKDNDNNTSGTYNYLNMTLNILPINNTPFTDQNLYDKMKSSATYGTGGVALSDLKQSFQFILGKRSDLNATKAVCNKVLSSSNMLTAVSYLLSKCGCSNVLMSKFDNNSIYNELILLPVPLINQLRYLNSYYGLYTTGAQFFFDLDRTYIIKNHSKCTAYNSTEVKKVIFHVYDIGGDSQSGKGSYTDSTNRIAYINVSSDRINVDDLSTTSSEYVGNNSLIINNNGGASTATTSDGTKSFNIITTSSHNKFITQETSLRLEELKSVVTIVTSEIDLNLLTPNKEYRIVSSSTSTAKTLNKGYRLVSVQIMLLKQGNYFTPAVTIKLKAS